MDNYAAGQSWVDLATYPDENGNDQFYAIFYKVNVKSLVWYSPDNFEDNGYEVPGTMEALIALTEQMANDGNTPWCMSYHKCNYHNNRGPCVSSITFTNLKQINSY